jgi:hypothetical protein
MHNGKDFLPAAGNLSRSFKALLQSIAEVKIPYALS